MQVREVMKSSTERTLLHNYNGKPFMLAPQMRCYQGVEHLEVDVDVHGYNYLGRKMLCSFFPRFTSMVLDGALVLQVRTKIDSRGWPDHQACVRGLPYGGVSRQQGNKKEELPERVVCCLRMYRMDFGLAKPFPSPPEPAAVDTPEVARA
jgi:hypothetical protein